MRWSEFRERGEGRREPSEKREIREEDEGPEEPDIDEEDEGPEAKEVKGGKGHNEGVDECFEEMESEEEDENPEDKGQEHTDKGDETNKSRDESNDTSFEKLESRGEDREREDLEPRRENDKSPDQRELSQRNERTEEADWKRETRGKKYYDLLARETRREVLGEKWDEKSVPESEGSKVEKTFREWDEAYYNRLARETRREVLGERGNEEPVPERRERGDGLKKRELERRELDEERSEPHERFEPPLSETDVKKNDEDISYVCRSLSREEVRSVPKERLHFLDCYHWFLDWREELLEKLNPDELSNFQEKHLKDTRKLAAIREFFENNKVTDVAKREPEKCEIVLNKYEELLNKRYNTLAHIEPRPTQSERAEPQQEHTGQVDSKPEGIIRVTREEWAQRGGDEKSVIMRATVSRESDGARFEKSIQHVRSESPLGDMEGVVKRTEVRVEKEINVDEDSVRRIWGELTNTKEAFITRTNRPFVGVLEPGEADRSRSITIVDRGEQEWLKNVDYASKTMKRWVDDKGVVHFEQCTQVIGHWKKNGETDIFGAAVTDRFRFGAEKDEKMRGETTFIRFDPKVKIEDGEAEKREGESQPSVVGGGSETSDKGERQQTVLKFYRGEDNEEAKNAYVGQVIYRVVHEPPPEGNATSMVEAAERASEAEGVVENLEGTSTNANSPVENTEPIDTAEELTSQPQQVVEGKITPKYSGEKVEDKNQIESVEQSSESSQKRSSDSEELRWEDVFILVEGRGQKRVFPVLHVLGVFVEGVRRNGGDEERYCEELRKRGAPEWLHGWLLRQMVYERRIPEEVLRVALEYLERNADKELGGDMVSLEPETNSEPQAEGVPVLPERGRKLETDDLVLKRVDGALSDWNVAFKTLEEEKKWLATLDYNKPTVLILGSVFSFSLFSNHILSKVIEVKNKSKLEGDDSVLRICYEVLRQFRDERCIDISRLLPIARYPLKKTDGRVNSSLIEAGMISDTYSSELEKIEGLLQLLGADYKKTPEGLYVLEALEPYEWANVPQKQLDKMSEVIEKTETLGTITELLSELKKLGVSRSVNYPNLRRYLRGDVKMLVDVYLKICHLLGIEKDLKAITQWRRLAADLNTGEWWNHDGIGVRIHPEDLKELCRSLLKELESRKISLAKFGTYLGEAESIISTSWQIKDIPKKRYVDTTALLEICEFLGRDPKTIRELDRNSMPKEETISLPRKVTRTVRLKAWEKYGSGYISNLARDIKVSSRELSAYINGHEKMSSEVLKKIEEALDIKIKDGIHKRIEVLHRAFGGETGNKNYRGEVAVEKIEIKEPNGDKRNLLTFIHKREEGEVFTEVPETGENFRPTLTTWSLSSFGTIVTVNRTKEFRDGKDLITYIVEKSIEKAGTIDKAREILNLRLDTEWLLNKKNDKITIKYLLTLAMYSGAVKKLSELTEYVEKVSTNEPKLEIDLNNPEGAAILTNMCADGSLSKGVGYRITYTNTEIDFLNAFIEKIVKVCGITPSIYEREDGVYQVYFKSNLVGRSFERAGYAAGDKALTNIGFPRFIIEGTTEMRKFSVGAMIADEGNCESRLKIALCIHAPELKEHRNTLNQIEGRIYEREGGGVRKDIPLGNLKDYEEILTIVKNKECNILLGVKKVIEVLLTEHGISLNEKDIQIKTPTVSVLPNHISIEKKLILSRKDTEELHRILGGFPGFKELMYVNHVSLREPPLKLSINLTLEEIETLKSIGSQYNTKDKKHYVISFEDEDMPEELRRRHAIPPDEILQKQKEYSEKEVEILVNGKPVKVRGMPSKIEGKILLGPEGNIVSWRLVPALAEDLKKKWESIKTIFTKEKEEEEREQNIE